MKKAVQALVRDAAEATLNGLRAKHPSLHFDLTILDSGSYAVTLNDTNSVLQLGRAGTSTRTKCCRYARNGQV